MIIKKSNNSINNNNNNSNNNNNNSNNNKDNPFIFHLQFKGENLDKGLSKADYKVKVGTGACEVQSLSANKLECMHPNDIPKKLTQADKCTEPDLRTIMVAGLVDCYIN